MPEKFGFFDYLIVPYGYGFQVQKLQLCFQAKERALSQQELDNTMQSRFSATLILVCLPAQWGPKSVLNELHMGSDISVGTPLLLI